MSTDQEFDDWFNDAAAAENSEAIGNQAAKFDDRETEARLTDADVTSTAFKCAGQVYARFNNADGTGKVFKASSGIIVRKDDDETYTMLTSNLSLILKQAGEDCEFDSGYFFLQKKGKGQFLALFKFESIDDIKPFDGFNITGDKDQVIACDGFDVAAVKLTLVKSNGDIPDPVELSEQQQEDVVKAENLCQMGYPNQSVVAEGERTKPGQKMKDEGNTIFYMKDKIDKVDDANETGGKIIAHSMDCSPGQEGGPLVNYDTGAVVGIFSGAATLGDGTDYYVSVMVDSVFMDWFSTVSW